MGTAVRLLGFQSRSNHLNPVNSLDFHVAASVLAEMMAVSASRATHVESSDFNI